MDPSKTTILLGGPGCIDGSATICLNRFGKAFCSTLEQLYAVDLTPKKPTNGKRVISTRSFSEDGLFRLNEILAIIFSGVKETLTVTTETKQLSLTPDHLVLTPDLGWIPAQRLRVGSSVYTESEFKKPKPPTICSSCGGAIKLQMLPKHPLFGLCYTCAVEEVRKISPGSCIEKSGYILALCPGHPRAHHRHRWVLEHILVMEAKLGRMLTNDERVHHIDENLINNQPSNLELTTNQSHCEHHDWVKNLALKVFVPGIEKIVSISNGGLRRTFDLRMKSPNNNFIANGIVVHNCGKTQRLLGIVQSALAKGVRPDKIGYVSFTKKATEEARDRACEMFSLLPDDLPHFRTLHSMAFKQLGMRRDQVLGWQHLRELGDSLGLEFKGKGQVEEDGVYGMGDADRLLFLEGLARTKKVPLQKVWEDAGEDEIDYLELDRFSRALAAFKRSRMLTDFGDMLDRWTVAGPSAFPKLDVLIVDEVQDTSNSQWDALDILSSKAEQVYVGGDDAQGIYSWSGANVDRFVGLQGAQVDLDQSWRVPRSAHKLASGIVDRIQNKRPRRWLPKAEEGAVNYYSSIEEVDMSSGDWLLLTRNGYQLTELENFCLTEGFSFNSVGHDPLKSKALKAIQIWESLRKGNDESAERILETFRFMPVALATTELLSRLKESESSRMFAVSELLQLGLKTSAIWHEALTGISPRERDYFIAARRRNEALLKRPRIRISTIHSAKGAEATNVLLLTDMSWRTHENMDRDFDAEARVWFVATTRASKTLNIVSPQTDLYFEV